MEKDNKIVVTKNTLDPDTVEAIRKTFNLEKPGAMEDAIDIFEDWIKQQNHFLKKDFSRDYLERVILRAKGSVERAKVLLEKMCTCRTALPQYFRTLKIKDLDLFKKYKIAPMPKLTKDYCRVTIISSALQSFEPEIMTDALTMFLHIMEYGCLHDYTCGAVVIFDYRNANTSEYLKTLDMNIVGHFQKIFLHGFDYRVKSMHYLTNSKLMKTIMAIYHQLAPAKIASRSFVHEDFNSLCEHLGTEYLPIEYGGTGPSVYKVADEYADALSSEEFMNYLNDMNNAKVDETLRPAGSKKDDLFGTEGTFRSLQFLEYLFEHDYCNGVVVIIDYTKINLMEMIKTMDIVQLGQIANLLFKAYSLRMKSIHIISTAKVINLFVSLVKQVVSEKIGNRIQAHKELDTLYEHVEKDILPEEYGGNEISMDELSKKWVDLLSSDSFMEYKKMMNAARTNENLRRNDDFNNQYLGMPGTFRTLSVD